jgi:hypothetical protein
VLDFFVYTISLLPDGVAVLDVVVMVLGILGTAKKSNIKENVVTKG